MKTLIASLLTIFAVVACSHSSSSDHSTAAGHTQDEVPALDLAVTKATEQKVKDGKLNEKFYSLKSDVDFSQGITLAFSQPNGTANASKVVRHSFPYHNQKLLTSAEEKAASSYCNFYIETSSDLPDNQMIVRAFANRPGQNLSMAAYNQNIGISISFSIGPFHEATLFCHNVFTKDDLEREIGQLISVTETP